MVTVSGRLLDFVEDPSIVAQVQVRAREVRPHGDGVMLDHPVNVEWDPPTGTVTFDAAAGTAGVVMWHAVGRSHASGSLPIVVPDGATATLRECVEAALLADEGTITALERLALEVTGMVATIQNIALLETWADTAKQDATTATSAATTAQEIATNLPATITTELDTRVPPMVPPLVANAIAEDSTVADAAAAAAGPAVDAAAAEIRWTKGHIPDGTDLNTWSQTGSWEVSAPIANSLVNAPDRVAAGRFESSPSGGGMFLQRFTITGVVRIRPLIRSGTPGGAWQPWQSATGIPEWLPSGADLGTFTSPGTWVSPSAIWSNGLTGMPPEVADQPFVLEVKGSITTTSAHRLIQVLTTLPHVVGQPPREFRRSIHNSAVTVDWVEYGAGGTADDPAAALLEDYRLGRGRRPEILKQESRLRRGGVVGTAGRTPVALSFDHGLTNFRDLVLPHLIRLGLPCTLALNPDDFGKASDMATWADLQGWALNHGIEMAHHGRDHGNVAGASPEGLRQKLLSTIPEYEQQMPEVIADAFIMPGASGTFYDGFNAGLPHERWWDHPAGRMILDNFPVVTSAMLGQAVPLTGEPVQTIDRIGMDYGSHATIAQDKIQSCYGTHLGVNIFMHPSQLTVDGRISPDNLVGVLEWLAAERDAGRLEVLTVSGFAWADPNRHTRLDIAPADQWASDTHTATLAPLMEWVRGAQMVLEATAATTGPLTMSATSDTGGLSASVTHDAVAGQRYRLGFSIPRTATTLTLTTQGTERACRVV